MCVIIIGGGKHRPTLRELQAAERQNPDGGGIAFRGKDGAVSIRKGLTARQVHARIKTLPKDSPFIAHFRYTTVGETSGALCHPFAIGKRTSTKTSLDGVDRAFFHNGTWSNWRTVMDAIPSKRKPAGEWSDTRALAFLMGHEVWPESMLDAIECKFAVLTETDLRVYPSDMAGWTTRNGVAYSNLRWTRRLASRTSKSSLREWFAAEEQEEGDAMDLGTPKRKKAKKANKATRAAQAKRAAKSGKKLADPLKPGAKPRRLSQG